MLTDDELRQCAEAAFDTVAPEYEATMGKPPRAARARVCRALAENMRKGLALVPGLSATPEDRLKIMITKEACRQLRKLFDSTA